jgi:hypothetical protein
MGATLGQGWLFGRPAPLPDDLPVPTHPLRLPSPVKERADTPFIIASRVRPPVASTRDLLAATSHHLENEVRRVGPGHDGPSQDQGSEAATSTPTTRCVESGQSSFSAANSPPRRSPTASTTPHPTVPASSRPSSPTTATSSAPRPGRSCPDSPPSTDAAHDQTYRLSPDCHRHRTRERSGTPRRPGTPTLRRHAAGGPIQLPPARDHAAGHGGTRHDAELLASLRDILQGTDADPVRDALHAPPARAKVRDVLRDPGGAPPMTRAYRQPAMCPGPCSVAFDSNPDSNRGASTRLMAAPPPHLVRRADRLQVPRRSRSRLTVAWPG